MHTVDRTVHEGDDDLYVTVRRADASLFDTLGSRLAPAVEKSITVFVKGARPGTCALRMDAGASIRALKGLVARKTGLDAQELRLVHGSKLLSLGTLHSNSVHNDATLELAPCAALPGGGSGREQTCDYSTKGSGRDDCQCHMKGAGAGCLSAEKKFGGKVAWNRPWVVVPAGVRYSAEEQADAVTFCKSMYTKSGSAVKRTKDRLNAWCHQLSSNRARVNLALSKLPPTERAAGENDQECASRRKREYLRGQMWQRLRNKGRSEEILRCELGSHFFTGCAPGCTARAHADDCAMHYAPARGNIQQPTTKAGVAVAKQLVEVGWMFFTKSTDVHCCACHVRSCDGHVDEDGNLQLLAGATAKTQKMLQDDDGIDRLTKRTRLDGMQVTNPGEHYERALDAMQVREAEMQRKKKEAAAKASKLEAASSNARKVELARKEEDMLTEMQALQVREASQWLIVWALFGLCWALLMCVGNA